MQLLPPVVKHTYACALGIQKWAEPNVTPWIIVFQNENEQHLYYFDLVFSAN